jgi:exodeoxyribonuclease V alpha subunit
MIRELQKAARNAGCGPLFQEYGVSPSYAARIYRQLGEDTIPLVEEDPYRLAEEVMGVGFKTADMIATKMGLDLHSPQRVKASLEYILSRASEEGHVYLPRENWRARALELLEGESEDEEALKGHCQPSWGSWFRPQEDYYGKEGGGGMLLPGPLLFCGTGVAPACKAEFPPDYPGNLLLEVELSDIERACGVQLAPRQREALEKALGAGVLVLTGGPGTGKTTTINALLELFRRFHLEVLLAAPTGRAAKRMAEATGREAKTIHRLLEFSRVEGEGFRFKKNEENPLKAHVVIVDEVSMVDILLMYNLLKALPGGCKLIHGGGRGPAPFGGARQRPPGHHRSGAIPVTRLETIFRQARGSSIIVNAHRINAGEMPLHKNQGQGTSFFMNKEDPGGNHAS